MNTPKTVCITATIAVLLSSLASAQTQQRFKQWDQNGDGKVSREEARSAPWLDQRFDRLDRNKDGILTREEVGLLPLATPSAQSPATRTSSPGMKRAFTFTRDYTPGTKDANGKMRSGQELMRIVAYKGQLFASTSSSSDPNLWMLEHVPDYTGCQVLRKADSKSEWQADASFGARYYRTDTLQVVRFTQDAHGKALPQPVEMLIAGLWDDGELFPGVPHSNRNRRITLAVRDDTTGTWIFSYGPTVPDFNIERGFASVRAIAMHIDQVTGREYLFLGAACGGMYKCVYDPSAPGSLRWLPGDELDKSYGRIHSFCVCNGNLYVSCDYGGLTVRNQGGGVYLRHDGEKPTWENVYRNYDPEKPTFNQTGRGITAVPAEDGSNKEVILVGIEYPPEPIIIRIEPHHNHRAETELNYGDYFKDNVFGGRQGGKIGSGYLAALNYFDAFIEPETGKKQYFVTIMIRHPNDPAEGCNNAYFLIRRGPGIYDWGEIDSGLPIGESLRGSRTVLQSPFADEPNAYYFGGYASDGGWKRPPRPNLCWIYKGVVGNRVAGTTSVNTIPPMPVSTYSNTTYGFSFAYPKSFITKDNSKVLFMATEANQAAPLIVANVVASGDVQNAVRQTFGTVFGSVDLSDYTEALIYLNGNTGYKGALKAGGIVGKEYKAKYQIAGLGTVTVVGFGWVKGDNVVTVALSYWGNYSEGLAKYLLNKIIASATYDSSQPPAGSGRISPQPRESPPRSRPSQPAGDLPDRFKQLDKNTDGKLTRNEVGDAAAFAGADADKDGAVTVEEYRRYVASRRTTPPAPATPTPVAATASAPLPVNGRPVLKQLPDCDAVRDAAGTGQLFECVHVPGITDVRAGMNGFALADLNRDGRPDLIAAFSPPATYRSSRLVVLLNEGGFRFSPRAITINGSKLTMQDFGPAAEIPNLADFNRDGFLDIVVSRTSTTWSGKNRSGIKPIGMTLLLSDSAWDRFTDVSERLGIRNELAYNRQSSFGDVNGDGWLDVAIGCDNIKDAHGGFPHSRLFVFKPNGAKFEDGKFEDIGGTDLVPDFGGFYHDSAKDKAGPGISLRDLDNDGDLDLLQSYHVDVRQPLLPYWPGEYRQGVMCWKNLLRETGKLRFEKITGNGLHCEARLKYNREKQIYEPASDARAPGLPYISLADVNCDGLQDVLAVGPDSDFWAPRVEHVTGRFWRNLGGFRFQDRTQETGFAPLNNTYGEWMAFFEEPRPARWANWKSRTTFESQPGLTPQHPAKNTPYYADSIFADFNNDGALDVVVLNRSESNVARAMLFMGKGDGTFEVKPTTFSGLDSSGICGEAADLDGDGLLDLVFAADPDNSLAPGQTVAPERYESKVYWNTGAHGAKENHWLRLHFTGVKDAELIGARVEVTAPSMKQYRWIHSNHTYKSGGALDAHFGLGKVTSAEVKVTLLNGKTKTFTGLGADKTHKLNLATP